MERKYISDHKALSEEQIIYLDRYNIPNFLADEKANTYYYQILRRFVSGKTSFPEENSCQPLDASGLKEIEMAWLQHNNTEKKLRSTYMKLYVDYLYIISSPSK